LSAEYLLLNPSDYLGVSDLSVVAINFSTNFFHSFFRYFKGFVQPDFVNSKMQLGFDEDETIELIDSEELNIYFYFSRGFKGLGNEEITINEKIYLNIRFKEQIALDKAIEKINYYKDFFSFLSSSVICFDSINVFAPNEKQENIDFNLVVRQNVKQIGADIRA
jgi:hypothetical protein